MKKITEKEFRQIECAILKEVADFCEINGITYFLAYGTLIGAIRHNGFIPWDDDIDIAMPRPDYDKFIRLFNCDNIHLKVIEMSLDNDYSVPFAKVYDDRTWIDEIHYKPEKYGVFIDIFPLDGIANSTQIKIAQILVKFLNTKKANFKKRKITKNIINTIGKIILAPFPIRTLQSILDKNSRKYAFGSTPKAGLIATGYGIREAVDTSIFNKTLFHEFEGREYRIPIGFDQWLKNIYGNYMELPPLEKRVSVHNFEAWWKD